MLQGALHGVRLALDPEIHGIAGDDSRTLDLFQYAPLKLRIDVAQEDIFRRTIGFGNHRIERLKNVELSIQGAAFIQVVTVFTHPAEGAALGSFQAFNVDLMLAEHRDVLVFEIISDHGNHTHRSKITRSHGEIGRGAAQNFIDFTKRCLHGIEGHRADNQNRTTHQNSL